MLVRFNSRVSLRRLLPALALFGLMAVLSVAGAACGSDSDGAPPGGACKLDSECASNAATPYCGAAGVCVACKESSHCSSAESPVCDQTSFTCRGCSADSECGSGVCLATLGTCALPEQLVYVKQDGVDTGTCEAAAPCATINYAKNRASATRNVIRVIGNLNQIAELQSKIHVDGDGGTWTADNGIILSVGSQNGDVTVEGLTLQGKMITNTFPVVQCLNGASLRLHQTTLKLGTPGVSAVCKVAITSSKILETRGSVDCMDGSLTIEGSELSSEDRKSILAARCAVKLERNKISGNPGPTSLVDITDPPMLSIENNLIWDRLTLTSTGLSVINAPTGGRIRFNTVVNTRTGAHTGEGVACVGTSVVSSNVIAWQNGLAQGVNACARRFNAFDAATTMGVGENSAMGTMATLFVDPAGDFHPGPTSPALGLADPDDKVPVDLDGKPRPMTGRLDAGAYELP